MSPVLISLSRILLKSIIEKMEKENAEAICMDFYGDEAIEFDIWKNGEYIKTIFTKKY